MSLKLIRNTTVPSIDRPDIVKYCTGRDSLSFKEVKDLLFKFLMQAEVPFVDSEKLYLPGHYDNSKLGVSLTVSNMSYYTATCRLLNLTVDNKPVYIVVLSEPISSINSRQKKKLLALKNNHNIVIFDSDDWKEVGIEISEKPWLKPLSRSILKKWARKLFSSIASFGKEVKSSYTLNDLFKAIDRNTFHQQKKGTILNTLSKENVSLQTKLREHLISNKFPIQEGAKPVITQLCELTNKSSIWVEEVINTVCNNISKTKLKESKEKAKFVLQLQTKLQDIKKDWNIKQISSSILEFQDLRTFQTAYIYIDFVRSGRSPEIRIATGLLKKLNNQLLFSLNLHLNKDNSLRNFTGEIAIISDLKGERIPKERKLQIYDSKIYREYKLWALDF